MRGICPCYYYLNNLLKCCRMTYPVCLLSVLVGWVECPTSSCAALCLSSMAPLLISLCQKLCLAVHGCLQLLPHTRFALLWWCLRFPLHGSLNLALSLGTFWLHTNLEAVKILCWPAGFCSLPLAILHYIYQINCTVSHKEGKRIQLNSLQMAEDIHVITPISCFSCSFIKSMNKYFKKCW